MLIKLTLDQGVETARFRHREDGGARNKGRETTGKRMETYRFMVFWFETSGERLLLLGLLSKRKVTWLLLSFFDLRGFHPNI